MKLTSVWSISWMSRSTTLNGCFVTGLESHLDLHVLLLKPSRLSQLSYFINLVIDLWRLVWVCLDRQDAASQAPLMLAKRGPIGGFGVYDRSDGQREDKNGHSGGTDTSAY